MIKDMRELLPDYLQLLARPTADGKLDKGKDNAGQIVNPFNNNSIKAFASATSKMKAASLLRGKTLTMLFWDEFAFSEYNDIIYMNAMPAFQTAFANARKNNAPYGITIATTPGFLSTDEGRAAYEMKEMATPFNEIFYDMTYDQLMSIIKANKRSDYVYIRYTHQELGFGEEWFNNVCIALKNSWPDIRREILLEWSQTVANSPFSEDDLNTLRGYIRQPISVTYLLGKYRFETYQQADTRTFPPIIGVDVACGYKHDSSTITVIDSKTTKVLGCMNSNSISTLDLSKCIEFLVKKWMPNSVVCVESNGIGNAVIGNLVKAGLKKNLYYEIKDKILEERFDGVHAYKQKVRTKVYGLNSTGSRGNNSGVRDQLIDILIERVENHKDKIISPIIYNEILGMEIKRNGRVEHSNATHDDQIFSMLMALYVWYNGTNLLERYGLKKTSIRTDDSIDEELSHFDPDTVDIVGDMEPNSTSEVDQEIDNMIKSLTKAQGIDYDAFMEKRRKSEKAQFENLVRTPLGQRAYKKMYSIPQDQPIERYIGNGEDTKTIPDSVFDQFYGTSEDMSLPGMAPNIYDFGDHLPGALPAADIGLYEGLDGYRYQDHFNF